MTVDFSAIADLLAEVDMDWSMDDEQEIAIGEQRLILDLATALREVVGELQAYKDSYRKLQVEHITVQNRLYGDGLWRDEVSGVLRRIRGEIAENGSTAPSKTVRKIDIILAALLEAAATIPNIPDPTKD